MLPSACLAYGPGVLPQVGQPHPLEATARGPLLPSSLAHATPLALLCAPAPCLHACGPTWLLPPCPQAFCGIEVPFLLVAKDTMGHKRTSGGDQFEVTVEDVATGAAVGSARVVDRGTGTYECFYRSVGSGKPAGHAVCRLAEGNSKQVSRCVCLWFD